MFRAEHLYFYCLASSIRKQRLRAQMNKKWFCYYNAPKRIKFTTQSQFMYNTMFIISIFEIAAFQIAGLGHLYSLSCLLFFSIDSPLLMPMNKKMAQNLVNVLTIHFWLTDSICQFPVVCQYFLKVKIHFFNRWIWFFLSHYIWYFCWTIHSCCYREGTPWKSEFISKSYFL